MRILVLSDLHIGQKARGKDLCPTGDNKWLDRNYINDFIDFISNEKIKADYLVVTGDISNSASFEEFQLGSNIIEDIAKGLKIPKSKVLLIPGNHDVDWKVLELADLKNESDLNFRKTQRYDTFKNGFNNNKKLEEFFNEPYFTSWDFDDLYVVGFNSAWHDENNAKIHHGLITDNIIFKLESHINSNDLSSKIKLFITHHHLYPYSDPISHEADFSIMTNSENLLKMLARNKFDMIAHGHKHIPRIITQEIDSIHPLSLLCAGSFSVVLDQRFNGSILNMFHVINFEGRDSDTDRIYGFIENYSYSSPHKWLKSERNNSNVLFQQGFGSYSSIKTLKQELVPIVSEEFKQKGSATWSKLCKDNRKLLYHTPDFITQLTDEIAKELELKKFTIENEIIFINHG